MSITKNRLEWNEKYGTEFENNREFSDYMYRHIQSIMFDGLYMS